MALYGMIQPQLLKFTGKNFDYWSIQIQYLFSSQELWDIVKDDFKHVIDSEFETLAAAKKEALKDCRKKDRKALFFLYQAVDELFLRDYRMPTQRKRPGTYLRVVTKAQIK
uniref:DUF4219 domain-containing protein n=1 Tax=Ananas comosus var. bracteatus TaxID=296719 RepID=A0A6V7Q3L4_ANACO|nr:unnamed protein product [Ananas comosus var. bracteatus]